MNWNIFSWVPILGFAAFFFVDGSATDTYIDNLGKNIVYHLICIITLLTILF